MSKIYALAISLSGSEHILTGGVRNRESYLWQTQIEAAEHLSRIGWQGIRFAKDVKELEAEVFITWDDGSKTRHIPGSGAFEYLKGGPKGGRKISKSELGESK